nr:glycerol-3-phosphate 1-O-acyltransferase PlsY [Robiginitomaculum antarcticum]
MGTLFISAIIAALFGYLLGSIPFGLLLAKMAGQGDIREIGSGNIGATNVLRTGRKDIAILTLVLDAAKAGLAFAIVKIALPLVPFIALIAACAALLGHCFPVWLKFKGGKGVATFFGALLAAAWPVGLIAGAIWLVTAFISRMSSLSALLAAALAPFIAFFMGLPYVAAMAAFMAVIIFLRHRQNIARIMKGEEPKVGAKKDAAS